MKATIKFFRAGMRLKDLQIFYSASVKEITVPGLRFKLIKEIGEKEYKKIRESFIKYPGHRKYYERRKAN